MLQQSINRLYLVLLLLPLLFLLGCSNEQSAGAPGSVEASMVSVIDAPDFEILDGSPVNLLTDARLQIINYWASWCLPCIEEMPELATFRNKHNEAVEIYAVNYDGLGIDQLREEVATLGVEIPALVQDPHELLGYEKPNVLPTTVVMLEGQVKDVLVGPQTVETLEAILDEWGK